MKLACIGNALIDIIAHVEPDFPCSIGVHPGSTEHVERAVLSAMLEALGDYAYSAGGGAANTARAFTALGGKASFAGAIGNDDWGRRYKDDLERSGVRSYLQVHEGFTGLFLSLCDSSGRRSIVVNPGAAARLSPSFLPDSFFTKDSVLYIDGFLALDEGMLEYLVAKAKSVAMPIAFDAGGQRLVRANRELFMHIICEDASWAFLNEDEFVALAEVSVDASLASFAMGIAGTLIVKRGETGAVCIKDGQLYESSVRALEGIDTTGAGDAFAAGFLKACLSGASLARCMRMGNWTAEHAIQAPGLALDAKGLYKGMSSFL
jgi:sugar/nucleoside kinase (ribokinase family)